MRDCYFYKIYNVASIANLSLQIQYLHSACDDPELQFPLELVGALPDWPESNTTVACLGSQGMTECIQDVPGTIGYISAGFGQQAEGITEVRLPANSNASAATNNSSVVFRTSAESSISGAVQRSVLPNSPDDDFSNVTFVDQPGADTWPIVNVVFLYVRKDLSLIEDPQEQALLIAFLRALYISEYIERCADLYGFTLLLEEPEIVKFAQDAIDLVEQSLDANATTLFEFEVSETIPIDGAGEYVFSSRRREVADLERAELTEQVNTLMMQVTNLTEQLVQTAKEVEEIRKLIRNQEDDENSTAFNTSARNLVEEPTASVPAATPTSAGTLLQGRVSAIVALLLAAFA